MKILEKKKILGTRYGLQSLLNEIKSHWALEHCDGILKLLGIHEDGSYVILVLEYQSKGSLMECMKT